MNSKSLVGCVCAVILILQTLGISIGVTANAANATNAKEIRMKSLLQKRLLKPLDSHTTSAPLRKLTRTSPEVLRTPRESVDTVWVRHYIGPGGGDTYPWPRAMAVDESNNVYIGGVSWGIGTGRDFTVISYDKNGNLRWVNQRDYEYGEDVLHDLAIDDSGYIYATGMCGPFDYSRVLTIKYNRNGDILWERQHSSAGGFFAYGEALALDDSGNVYVTGGDVSPDVDCDFLTIKYDRNGNEIWHHNFDWPGIIDEELPYDIAVDSLGNAYVTGTYEAAEILTVKYSPDGDTLWTRWSWDGTYGVCIALDDSANVFVSGWSWNPVIRIKYDSNGNQQWQNTTTGTGAPCELIVDAHGDIIEAGPFTSASYLYYEVNKFDNHTGDSIWTAVYGDYHGVVYDMAIDNSGNIYITGFVVGPACEKEYGTVKFDSNGNQIWAIHYYHPNTYGYNIGYAVAVDNSGYVYVTGEADTSGSGAGPMTTIKYKQLPGGIDEQHAITMATCGFRITNPIKDNIIVYLPDNFYGHMTLALYDVAGILVKNINVEITEHKRQINLSAKELPRGIYFLQLNPGTGNRTFKVVKIE